MIERVHIEFVVALAPYPKGRHRIQHVKLRGGAGCRCHVHTPQETIDATDAFRLMARKHRPRKPLAGPLRVDTIFVVQAPTRLDAERSALWPHVKPDDDNYRKLVLDALNGEFWHDDGQVCGGSSFKVYGYPARTLVRIRPLTLEDYETVLRELGEEPAQPALFGGTNV